jgi:DnaJ like chaperone protein
LQGAISEEEAGNLLAFILQAAGEDRLNDRMVRLLHQLAEILDVEVPPYRRARQAGLTSLTLAYSVLRLSPEASDEELSDAFRSLAKVHHPDKFASEDEVIQRKAKERFQEILQAFEEIKASRGLS